MSLLLEFKVCLFFCNFKNLSFVISFFFWSKLLICRYNLSQRSTILSVQNKLCCLSAYSFASRNRPPQQLFSSFFFFFFFVYVVNTLILWYEGGSWFPWRAPYGLWRSTCQHTWAPRHKRAFLADSATSVYRGETWKMQQRPSSFGVRGPRGSQRGVARVSVPRHHELTPFLL